jgi:peptidoglycan/LPS O-acetylase OafA/YrhL
MRTDLRLDGLLWGCCAGILFENLRRRGALCFQVPEIALWAAIGLDVLYLTRGVPTGAIWSPALLAVFIILTVLHPAWKTSRVLDFPVLQWIGRISYSLYIWQQLFLVPSWEAHPLGRLQLFPLNLLASLVCAIFSYFVIEQPAIRFGRSLIRRKATSRNEEQSGIKVIQAA